MINKNIAKNDLLIEEMINSELYKIQNNGEIYTLITLQGNKSKTNEWRKCSVNVVKSGYGLVRFKNVKLLLHRIMYRKFIGPLNENLVINHKDGNKLNNIPENLELITSGANLIHKYQKLGFPAVKGNKKISEVVAERIRVDRRNGMKYKELCKKYLLSKSSISFIVNYKTWK